MSHPSRKTIGDSANRSSGRSETNSRDSGRQPSQRKMHKDESTLETQERPREDFKKGDLRTGVSMSHSRHHPSGHSSRDKDHGAKRSDPSGREEHERTSGSSSSRSSREYDHRERDRGKDRPPPALSGDNRELSRIREDHAKERHDRRPLHEPSKSRVAPPQATLVNSEETTKDYASTGGRDEKHEGHTAPAGDSVPPPPPPADEKPGNKGAVDIAMAVEEALSDTEMDNDWAEARKIQEEERLQEEEQVRKDRELAMAVQKIEDSNDHDRRSEESGPESGSDTDGSQDTRQAAESQGLGSRIYSIVAGNVSPPRTKEEKLKAELYDLRKAYKKKAADAQGYYEQGYKYYMECGALQRKVEMMDQERRSMASELAHTKQQLSDAINLSEVRGKELKGAQVFLTKADSLSVSDVVQKVAALNEEIFQAGALLAETLVIEPAEANIEDNTMRRQAIILETRDNAYKFLGTQLTDLLATESMKPQEGGQANQLLVQIVLLIALTKWCASACRGWVAVEKETNKFLEELYDEIRRAEDQAVAGRWRSLTRAHLSITTSGWTGDVMHLITCIMGLAGWTPQSPDDLPQFEKRLSSIFKALRDVRKATGEDVTSADLEVFAARRGDDYEAGLMEDSYGDDRAGASANEGEKEKVAGPSGLGLRKVYFVKLPGGAMEKRAEYLSLPKVVLERTVKEAIEPPPPPKPRKKKEPGAGGLRGMIGL